MYAVFTSFLKAIVCVALGYGFSQIPEEYANRLTRTASKLHYMIAGLYVLLAVGYGALELFA